MKIVAIICEYNPFHNGHKYQINRVRETYGDDTAIIALMSGNYVQRGDVAIFSKAARAEAAICGGADLVLELPVVYAVQSAEFFAKNAVLLINSLGMVDVLAFGAEYSDITLIQKIADFLCSEPLEFSKRLGELCDDGISFPAAREIAIDEFLGSSASKLLKEPNNILAIEYCKALRSLNSSITPLLLQREGTGHHDLSAKGNLASATYIRELIRDGKISEALSYIPDCCHDIFLSNSIHSIKAMEKSIIAEIIKTPVCKLREISDVGEGMENRIKEKANASTDIEKLTDNIKTKRYTHSRIRRVLLSSYLGITTADRESKPEYIRILAHNEIGQRLIKKSKASSSLPLIRNTSQINRLNNPSAKEIWERERIFDLIYDLF